MKPGFAWMMLCVCALAGTAALAQGWKPEKPVEVVIGLTAGSSQDRTGRALQKVWQETNALGVPVNVVNRPGGGGQVAWTYLAQHAGDAHYLQIASPTLLARYITGLGTMQFTDFTPLALLGGQYLGAAVRPDSSIKSARDLMERLKRDPYTFSLGINSAGGTLHIMAGLLVRGAGGDPKKARIAVFQGGELMTAGIGGHVDAIVTVASNILPHVESGKLNMLAVAAPRALEARVGFGKIFAGMEGEAAELTRGLGGDWAIMKVSFKPYPLPAWNQTPVLLGLRVRQAMGARAARHIEVRMSPYEVNYPSKNSTGPFENDTSAKLSILFTVATTLAHGEPTFPLLLDYENGKTSELLKKMTLVADPEIPRLSCKIRVMLENGQAFEDTMIKSWSDYSFSCDEVSKMVRRIGKETAVPEEAYDRLDDFVRKLPRGGAIQEVVESFAFINAR